MQHSLHTALTKITLTFLSSSKKELELICKFVNLFYVFWTAREMKFQKSSKMKAGTASLQIRGLLKVHKPDSPIRPVINWTNAAAYKIAKQLVQILDMHLPLPYVYNSKNTIHLLTGLRQIHCNNNLRFVSFDISNITLIFRLIRSKTVYVSSVPNRTSN